MWTPRRFVLLLSGFVVYLVCYLGYARSHLGVIDGLPALPEIYARSKNPSGAPIPHGNDQVKPVDRKLAEAFGPGCKQLKWPIKLELQSKSTVIASEHFEVADGRVHLEPVSLAVFGKNAKDSRFAEINTIRAKHAYLTFDRPVANVSEISGRKLEEAELIDSIEVINNHRTVEDRSDDLVITMDNGPVYYREKDHRIWTHDHVRLVDHQSKPDPTQIDGDGMEMDLLTEGAAKPGSPAGRKPKQDAITGVKRIVLQSNVSMSLYADGGSGFPASPKETPPGDKKPAAPGDKKAAAAPPAPKAKIHITAGRFQYDFGKDKAGDVATFDAQPANASQPIVSPQVVHVTRTPPPAPGVKAVAGGPGDQLICEHLVLCLRHKQAENAKALDSHSAPAAGTPEQAMEIESAHATGPVVTLTSDAENLDAQCVDLLHDAASATTTLTGGPQVRAEKDHNVIYARQLRIQEQKLPGEQANPQAKKYQQVHARGPGHLDLADATTKKSNAHAYWMDSLTTSRDGPHDLIVLTGNARFVDDEHQQTLQAETIKLWVDDAGPSKPKDKAPPAKPKTDKVEASMPGPAQGRRPHHLEALKDVVVQGRDLNIHECRRLVVYFKDVSEEEMSQTQPERKPAAPPQTDHKPDSQTKAGEHGNTPVTPAAPPAAQARNSLIPGSPVQSSDKNEPARPIDLSARSVEAWVWRSETRNTLKKLWTSGDVHVVQEPAKADEKGIDIKGETLELFANPQANLPEGNLLVVRGDLAQLLMDKIFIMGPEVNIDQQTNQAWVRGPGAMRMESNTTFGGNKMAKTVPMTVHWEKSMLFGGNFTEFHGGIQAEQDNARLACHTLVVTFDRVISLKQGVKADEKAAKVEHLVCDGNVRIEEAVLDEGGKLVKWQEVSGAVAEQNRIKPDEEPAPGVEQKDDNEVNVTGPGKVKIYQQGGADLMATSPPKDSKPPAKPPAKPKNGEEPMKLTYVEFSKRMYANSLSNTAKFWGEVRVLDMPTDNPRMGVDLDTILNKMLKDAMYLSSEQLTVLTRKDGTATHKEMEALRRVMVQSDKFWGRCDKLTYNEAKDQVVFHGTETEPAHLYRQLAKGGRVDQFQGKTIVYIRSTGLLSVDGGGWISGQQP